MVSLVPRSSLFPAFGIRCSFVANLFMPTARAFVLLIVTGLGWFASGAFRAQNSPCLSVLVSYLFPCVCLSLFKVGVFSYPNAYWAKSLCLMPPSLSYIMMLSDGVTAEGVEPAAAFAIGRTAPEVFDIFL